MNTSASAPLYLMPVCFQEIKDLQSRLDSATTDISNLNDVSRGPYETLPHIYHIGGVGMEWSLITCCGVP